MSTRSAGDPSILLPEIEVSDLVDAIPIDIVGELLTEEDNIDDNSGRGSGRGGINSDDEIINNTNKTSSKAIPTPTPTDGLNIIQPRPPFKTDSFNRGSQQYQGGGGGSSGGRSSNGNSLGGGGGSFPSIPPVYSMTSPGRLNSTEQFTSTVGFALKGGSTSSSTDAFALTSDVDAILNGAKPFVPSVGGTTVSEVPKSTTTTATAPIVQGPSGPRMPGQGVEEQEQVVVSTETDENGGVRVRVTLLAAGFVIGNAGASVREITQHTGASIRSWTQPAEYFFGGFARPTRVFCVEGEPAAIAQATELIYAAVDRYRALCEMKKRGEFVQRSQKIKGVEFSFQPPPRQITQRQRQLEILNAQTNLLQQQTNVLSGAAAGGSAVALQAFAQQQLLMQQQLGLLNQQMPQIQQQGYYHHHQHQQYQQHQHYQQQQQQQQFYHQQQQQQQQHNMFGANQNYY